MARVFGFNMNHSVESVIDNLKEIVVKKADYKTEVTVQKIMIDQLRKENDDVVREYNIGGYLGLKVDFDFADGEVGIELKLAKELTKPHAIQRLFGQAIYYDKRKYHGRLIVCVVGTASEEKEPKLKEVKKFLGELDVKFHFIRVK